MTRWRRDERRGRTSSVVSSVVSQAASDLRWLRTEGLPTTLTLADHQRHTAEELPRDTAARAGDAQQLLLLLPSFAAEEENYKRYIKVRVANRDAKE